MFEQGVEEEVRAAGEVAPQVLGLDAVRTLPREEAIAELERATLRFAAYQRKWMRRIPGIVMIDAERPAGEVADAISPCDDIRSQGDVVGPGRAS